MEHILRGAVAGFLGSAAIFYFSKEHANQTSNVLLSKLAFIEQQLNSMGESVPINVFSIF